MKILQNSSIKYLRRKLEQQRPDAIDSFLKVKKDQSSWSGLSAKQKEFYTRVSDLEFLNQDYLQTQQFFQERIEKIKEDSSYDFNSMTVKQVIQDYV